MKEIINTMVGVVQENVANEEEIISYSKLKRGLGNQKELLRNEGIIGNNSIKKKYTRIRNRWIRSIDPYKTVYSNLEILAQDFEKERQQLVESNKRINELVNVDAKNLYQYITSNDFKSEYNIHELSTKIREMNQANKVLNGLKKEIMELDTDMTTIAHQLFPPEYVRCKGANYENAMLFNELIEIYNEKVAIIENNFTYIKDIVKELLEHKISIYIGQE